MLTLTDGRGGCAHALDLADVAVTLAWAVGLRVPLADRAGVAVTFCETLA